MMRNVLSYFPLHARLALASLLLFISSISFVVVSQVQAQQPQNEGKKLVTIHDRQQEKVMLTEAKTVQDALNDAHISLDKHDSVEPKLSSELIDNSYYINIYRARPVIVADGLVREKIMTASQTADKIAADAGITLHDQDKTALKPTEDIVAEGAGVELQISRAIPLTLVLYGKKTTIYTQAKTIRDMLKEKKITLSSDDHISVALDATITSDMIIELSRNGTQTVTEEQPVAFTSEKVYDTARPAGSREIQSAGQDGKRAVTYEVVMKDGREISRKEIQSVVIQEPKKAIEIIGLNPGSGLSRSKGANMFTDSKGVVHRETYYDLPMSAVMGACGGGDYTVRPDGVKVDKDGYILIAANLSRYQRCSVVQTSLGLAKVYDTGGFVSRYPDGYDLATDWSNNNGR